MLSQLKHVWFKICILKRKIFKFSFSTGPRYGGHEALERGTTTVQCWRGDPRHRRQKECKWADNFVIISIVSRDKWIPLKHWYRYNWRPAFPDLISWRQGVVISGLVSDCRHFWIFNHYQKWMIWRNLACCYQRHNQNLKKTLSERFCSMIQLMYMLRGP